MMMMAMMMMMVVVIIAIIWESKMFLCNFSFKQKVLNTSIGLRGFCLGRDER